MILLFLLTNFLVLMFYNFYWKRRNLPPGPTPWPILGNAPQMSRYASTEAAYIAWSKIYGDTFTFWFGERPVVAICDYHKIVEYFQKNGEKFQDRPDDSPILNYTRGSANGIILIYGELWRSQRRFALHALRDFGLGKDIMEERVIEECTYLCRTVNREKEEGAQEHEIVRQVDRAIGSVINNLLFGYRYTEKNIEEFEDLKHRAAATLKLLGHPLTLAARPNPQLFEKFPVIGPILKQCQASQHHLANFFKQRIDEHKEELRNEDWNEMRATDLVAAYLKEQKKLLETEGNPSYFTDNQLTYFCFDIWLAGQETTSNTIGWGLAYLIHHPEIQAKIHAELDKVIGSDRVITMADRPDLPYINAVCNETQRLSNLVPSNVIHATAEDVNVEGYRILKGTAITPMVSCVLYNEKIFPEPFEFKPERYIDEHGKLKKVDELIPFSVGKRQCLGEGLARMEIFLFLANLHNQYKFSPAEKLPSLQRSHGITVKCDEFNCKIEKRFK